ncbi:hypothetical protein M407DRAFT_28627 [Tulasnella calospora MUT 4182]|uniref:Uncharacterized protein n=1 Tax=Tulasnella calospora MUT 4182 TaxID=1051891 RepID=A0A0C3Q140_9AGAM|nr:hypothetical protein M407DRAFT_28627 [Tulasnella calospora MUT 4182]
MPPFAALPKTLNIQITPSGGVNDYRLAFPCTFWSSLPPGDDSLHDGLPTNNAEKARTQFCLSGAP